MTLALVLVLALGLDEINDLNDRARAAMDDRRV